MPRLPGPTRAPAICRLLKTGVSGRDPALRGSGECSHTGSYAALPPSPCALADGPILVFQHPVGAEQWTCPSADERNPPRSPAGVVPRLQQGLHLQNAVLGIFRVSIRADAPRRPSS